MPSAFQWTLGALLAIAGWVAAQNPGALFKGLSFAAAAAFLAVAAWRILLVVVSGASRDTPPPASPLPRYTILAALHDEAEVVGQLIERLANIDYPTNRLQGLIVLEAHDTATRRAARAVARPSWLKILVVPPGRPQTKPRALNFALTKATGQLLTVYDAEDEPDPGQLREAAARFAADAHGRLACLQAPLRIRRPAGSRTPFLDRQFAAEYAALFETALPGMSRLGLPFPLGGTSNHFRVDVLRAVGGWDAYNVTEDADLGFRLWTGGWRLGVLTRPTWETPPGEMYDWLPQRTRWLKGYMQTWGVHTRRPWRLGLRGLTALVMTLGAGLMSAAANGPSMAWVSATVLVALMDGHTPMTPAYAVGVMVLGAAAAWTSCLVGTRRAGVPYGPLDMIMAPAYWSLLSLAMGHAAWRLIWQPFAWDKTRHRCETPPSGHAVLDETAPDRLSAGHAATPEPVA
ncbi:glycosyltransferase [Brevundimonas sp. Root1279]|nr:glycosyltransferase [Brevundimonas sp. Root1279]